MTGPRLSEVAHVQCPECDAVIPVTFTFAIDPHPYIATDGEVTFMAHADPDLTDVWAHAWAHQEGAAT